MRADSVRAAARNVSALLQKLATANGDDSRTVDLGRVDAAKQLGALGEVTAVPALILALSHPNQVCIAAALALGSIAHPDAVGPLTAVLEDDAKFWMPRGAAAVALGQMGSLAHAALPALTKALELDVAANGTAWDVKAREAVADAIRHITDPTAGCVLKGKGERYAIWGIY